MKIQKIKGQMSLVPVIIGIMVAAIIGIAVTIPVIQDQVTSMTALATNTESNVNSKNGTTTTLAYGDLVAGTFAAKITNGSAVPAFPTNTVLAAGNYTVTIASGSVLWTMTPGSNVANNATLANVSYKYYPSGYVKNPMVVTLIQLIPLFIAVMLLISAVSLIIPRA